MQRTALLLTILLAVLGGGTAWYGLVEGFSLLDAVYQAVTTISTVGFKEVQPLDTSGRIFTIGYILTGIGVMFYVATSVAEQLIVGEVTESLGLARSSRKVNRMERHFVVCGYGRVGREVADELLRRGERVVVIEQETELVHVARDAGCGVVHGDATEDGALREARIEHAQALIAAADADVENTYIVLSARALNPGLYIVARTGTDAAESRMTAAGANRVVSPYRIGGRRMALTAVQPLVLDFLDRLSEQATDGSSSVLAELVIADEAGSFAGRTISDVFSGAGDLRVLGLERPDGSFEVGPGGTTLLSEGDRLMLYGEQRAIERLSPAGRGNREAAAGS